MRVAHYREAFLPPGSITETGTAHSGAGETAGNWRQLDVAASLKPEIALASTFSRRGNQSENRRAIVQVARATEVNPEMIGSLEITRTRVFES